MIESAAYRELQSLVIRLCGRIAHLASSTVSPKPDKWLTQEEVCKALRITKRALQYYRQTGVIPYTVLGNKIFFKYTFPCSKIYIFTPITIYTSL